MLDQSIVNDLIELVPWPNCTITGEEITDNEHPNTTLAAGYASVDMESCSRDCQKDNDCLFWVWRSDGTCLLKTGLSVPTVEQAGSVFGGKDCYGRGNSDLCTLVEGVTISDEPVAFSGHTGSVGRR